MFIIWSALGLGTYISQDSALATTLLDKEGETFSSFTHEGEEQL